MTAGFNVRCWTIKAQFIPEGTDMANTPPGVMFASPAGERGDPFSFVDEIRRRGAWVHSGGSIYVMGAS